MDKTKIIPQKQEIESLQKFTTITDKSTLERYTDENPGFDKEELLTYLSNYPNNPEIKSFSKEWQRRAKLLICYTEMYYSPEIHENYRNTLYSFNHAAIVEKMHEGIMKHGVMPTVMNLAQEVGLSRVTVYKHLNDIKENKYLTETRLQQSVLVENAISKLYKIGMEDKNPTALKHFIQFADPLTKAKTINNYIQVNNVKITQEKIQKLPYEVKKELESILIPYQLESP